MDVPDLAPAEGGQDIVDDHRPVGALRRRRLARQMLDAISFGEIFDRRRLALLAFLARWVFALVDTLAQRLAFMARRQGAPGGIVANRMRRSTPAAL